MALHKVARGHVPLIADEYGIDGESYRGFLRVGPQIEKHDPVPAFWDISGTPYHWLGIFVDYSQIDYSLENRAPRSSSGGTGEWPITFSGVVVDAHEQEFEVHGLHYQSGNYRGSIWLPEPLEVIQFENPLK